MVKNLTNLSQDDQVSLVVSSFVQVWNQFESSLAKELAQVQERLEGMQLEKESHPNANYELFYRIASSMGTRGSLTMGELSSLLSVTLSTATRIADWLVENGYIRRLPDPEDRRVVRVALTAKGKELRQTIDTNIQQRLQQVLSSLTGEERNTLLALIAKVVGALKGAAG